MSPLDNIIGPFLIASMLDLAMLGIVGVQAVTFFTSGNRRQAGTVALVSGMLVLDVLSSALSVVAVYSW